MDFTARQEKGLRKLAFSFPGFFILRYFRGLKRSRSYHTVEYLQSIAGQGAVQSEREDLMPTYGDVLEFVKQLDKLGFGTYVQGRKGHKTRIEWAEGTCLSELGLKALPDIAEAIAELDLQDGATELGVQESDVINLTPQGDGWLNPIDTLVHRYQLRPKVFVEFAVPQDLSQLEAQRLAAFVGSLSMEA